MTTIEYLDRELRRVELSMRRAAKKPNTPPEELRGLEEKRANLCEARAAVLEMQARPEAPAADVRPVVRGYWEFPIFMDSDANNPRCKCSVCGSIETPLARHKFCPNCGAEMNQG